MRVWDAQTRQTLRVLQSPAKGPITALLVLDRPPHLAAGGRGGGGGEAACKLESDTFTKHPPDYVDPCFQKAQCMGQENSVTASLIRL